MNPGDSELLLMCQSVVRAGPGKRADSFQKVLPVSAQPQLQVSGSSVFQDISYQICSADIYTAYDFMNPGLGRPGGFQSPPPSQMCNE